MGASVEAGASPAFLPFVGIAGVFLLLVASLIGRRRNASKGILFASVAVSVFSAACGTAVGFAPQHVFAVLIPILTAGLAGTMICAIGFSANRKDRTDGDHPADPSIASRFGLAIGTAKTGVPLILGAYYGNAIQTFQTWYPDIRRLVAVLAIIGVTTAVVWLMARGGSAVKDPGRSDQTQPQEDQDRALCFAGAAFGAFLGMATGLSEVPVVSYMAPASLALFSAMASDTFSAGSGQDARRLTVGRILVCFGLLLIVSIFLGAAVRIELSIAGVPRTVFAFATLLLLTVGMGGSIGLREALLGDRTSPPETRPSLGIVGALIDSLLHRTTPQLAGALGFALTGAAIGLATGMSRTPVIHVVLPALLAALAGLIAFAVGKSKAKASFRDLLAAFGLALLVGGFVGYALQPPVLIEPSRSGEAEPTGRIEGGSDNVLAGSVAAPTIPERTQVVYAEEILRQRTHLFLEGSSARSALVITVTEAWSGEIWIEDRVQRETLFRDVPTADQPVVLVAESFRIRWPLVGDGGGLTIVGWERIDFDQETQSWAVEGQGGLIPLVDSNPQGAWNEILYPASGS